MEEREPEVTSVQKEFLAKIRTFADWPAAGVNFVDIMPVLKFPLLLQRIAQTIAEEIREVVASHTHHKLVVAGLEARGFLLGPLVAIALEVPFVCLRKKGKLPGKVFSATYQKEYGPDNLEVQADAISPGSCVVIVDDLLATGGTSAIRVAGARRTLIAAMDLVKQSQAFVAGVFVLVELPSLGGRAKVTAAGLTTPLWALVTKDF